MVVLHEYLPRTVDIDHVTSVAQRHANKAKWVSVDVDSTGREIMVEPRFLPHEFRQGHVLWHRWVSEITPVSLVITLDDEAGAVGTIVCRTMWSLLLWPVVGYGWVFALIYDLATGRHMTYGLMHWTLYCLVLVLFLIIPAAMAYRRFRRYLQAIGQMKEFWAELKTSSPPQLTEPTVACDTGASGWSD